MRIFLVDPSEIFRMGLRALLNQERDLMILGEAHDAASAFEAVRGKSLDLVIADIDPPAANALVLARGLQAAEPATRVLALAATGDEVAAGEAILAGVAGWALKSDSPAKIVAAAREVVAGRRVLPEALPTALPSVLGGQRSGTQPPVLDRLSAREREIFELIIWGQTNKQVAASLGISVKTVETHRSHINGKLQVHSAAELVRLASLCGALVSTDHGKSATAEFSVARHAAPRLVAKIG